MVVILAQASGQSKCFHMWYTIQCRSTTVYKFYWLYFSVWWILILTVLQQTVCLNSNS